VDYLDRFPNLKYLRVWKFIVNEPISNPSRSAPLLTKWRKRNLQVEFCGKIFDWQKPETDCEHPCFLFQIYVEYLDELHAAEVNTE
jgi:hypothetical protein